MVRGGRKEEGSGWRTHVFLWQIHFDTWQNQYNIVKLNKIKLKKIQKKKKMRDNKGTFHAKMGSIKDRNGMDLTEAEDIKKRWQKYTEELHKKRSSQPR